MLLSEEQKNNKMEAVCFAGDQWVPLRDAGLPLSDLGLRRGYAVFDFLRVTAGVPLFLSKHVDRFFTSATEMRLGIPFSPVEIQKMVHQIIDFNQLQDAGIRLMLTGGSSPDGVHLGIPRLFIVHENLVPPANHLPAAGFHLITHSFRRQFTKAKTTDYAMELWLRPMVDNLGANDVLYHQDGFISECPRCNFFAVNRAGQLITTDKHILHGITRATILEIAREIGVDVELRDLHVKEIPLLREAFISSTTKRIIPVSRIDDVMVPMDGKVTDILYQRFLQREQAEITNGSAI